MHFKSWIVFWNSRTLDGDFSSSTVLEKTYRLYINSIVSFFLSLSLSSCLLTLLYTYVLCEDQNSCVLREDPEWPYGKTPSRVLERWAGHYGQRHEHDHSCVLLWDNSLSPGKLLDFEHSLLLDMLDVINSFYWLIYTLDVFDFYWIITSFCRKLRQR